MGYNELSFGSWITLKERYYGREEWEYESSYLLDTES